MDLVAALALQIEWGADEALAELPADRLAAAQRAPVPPASRPILVRQAGQAALTGPAGASPLAPGSAGAAGTGDMAALLAAYAAFDGCALRETATSFVAPSGDPTTGLVWLTGPPGEHDDRTGLPAAGPDGALLDAMLASIGLTRGALLLVPVLPWRPPGGRPPNPAECAQCLPFLLRLLALAKPRTLVAEAGLPVQTLLSRAAVRGRPTGPSLVPLSLAGDPAEPTMPVAALAMPSLSSIGQSADRRREAWQRLCLLRRHLDG